MAAPMRRVVGWIDRSEWQGVFSELYSDDMQLQQHAVDKIAVWKCRCLNKLSTAIECTTELVSAHIQDANNTDKRGCKVIQMTYAMALIRFVNLITEKSQSRQYSRPVYSVAGELGLPEWLVDLRHDATHSNLPSLPVLRHATQYALQWLRNGYWEPQSIDDPMINIEKTATEIDEEDVSKLLMSYMQIQHERQTNLESSESARIQKQQLQKPLDELERALRINGNTVMKLLAEDGFMIPTKEQLEFLKIDLDDVLQTPSDFPPRLVFFWHPVLKVLQKVDAINKLLVQFMEELMVEDGLRNKLLVGWIILIVTANANAQDLQADIQKEVSAISSRHNHLPGRHLVELCLKQPNRFTSSLLHCLFKYTETGLGDEQKDKLLELVSIYIAHPEHSLDDSCTLTEIHTLETLSQELDTFGETVSTNTKDFFGTTAKVIWTQFPIGCYPDKGTSWTSLELPPSVDDLGEHLMLARDERHTDFSHNTLEKSVQAWTPEDLKQMSNKIVIL